MEEFTRLLTFALAVVSIATLAGLGLQRGRIASLREQLDDSRKEVADLDRRLESETKHRQRLENDLAALGRVVTGEAYWTAISDKLDQHHSDAETHWGHTEALLGGIKRVLEDQGHAIPPR